MTMLPSADGAAILVADVSGHGASAAMLTGIVKSAFHSASPISMNRFVSWNGLRTRIRAFARHRFITLICARVRMGPWISSTPDIRRVFWSRLKTAALLEATGPIISPSLKCSWEQHAIQVKRGSDRIVLFTDAIIEAESESGEYGLNRLIEEVSKRPIEGNALSEQILESVRQFAFGRPIKDDLTLVIADL